MGIIGIHSHAKLDLKVGANLRNRSLSVLRLTQCRHSSTLSINMRLICCFKRDLSLRSSSISHNLQRMCAQHRLVAVSRAASTRSNRHTASRQQAVKTEVSRTSVPANQCNICSAPWRKSNNKTQTAWCSPISITNARFKTNSTKK